jgi:hypothetical protein
MGLRLGLAWTLSPVHSAGDELLSLANTPLAAEWLVGATAAAATLLCCGATFEARLGGGLVALSAPGSTAATPAVADTFGAEMLFVLTPSILLT